MGNGVTRVALWALVVLLLAGSLAAVAMAQAGSPPNYTLLGYVEQPNSAPVPTGVTVDLISSGTHQSFETETSTSSGQFSFSSTGNAPALSPGWWGLRVPPQAHVPLLGGQWAVLPQSQGVQYFQLNGSQLTTNAPVTLTGVTLDQYSATLTGNVSLNGRPIGGASVQLLDPSYNGFVLANNTTVSVKTNTTHVGEFSLSVPTGSFVLETSIAGSPPLYNYTAVTIGSGTVYVNPALSPSKSYVTWGFVNLKSSPTSHVPNGGNVTVFDPLTGGIYSQPTSSGGFYSVGTYGAQTFDIVLSTVGYQTVWYPLTVSPSSPSGGTIPRNVLTSPIAPPAVYSTVLDWSKGLGKLNVTTTAVLGNDSVFPDLANASVGQLWSQLALDWQHNLTFSAANFPQVRQWIQSAGPFFPAGQSSTLVNNTGYGQPFNVTLSSTNGCANFCGLNSSATMKLNWTQNYNLTAKLSANQKSYAITFQFRHPTNSQAFNYTAILPAGYVLEANAQVPTDAALVPAGPGGTWTSFTLVSKPSASAYGTTSFKIVKYGNVSAAVNISSTEFSWSNKNIVNASKGHYAVLAGAGENLSFSGLNSIFPAGTNGTLYHWKFGDGAFKNVSSPTTNHTYAVAGTYVGSLNLTSSGGRTSQVPFTVYVGSSPPVAQISVSGTNVSARQIQSFNGANYLVVNWSALLHFNASNSTAPVNAGPGAPSGVISVALWNITDAGSQTYNYTASSGKNPLDNVTTSFLGKGKYLSAGTVGSQVIPGNFLGWQYNVTLTVWDYGGHNATTSLIVLVKDTQKPVPSLSLKSSKGRIVSSAGVVEDKNHTAQVFLSAANSTDPTNGSIALYNFTLTNANKSADRTILDPVSGPNYPIPAAQPIWLQPQAKPYTVTLTVTDRAGNKANTSASLTVAVNTSLRPVLSLANLTAPSTMTAGTSYTISVNVTDLFGLNSTAMSTTVRFYLLPPSGTGSPINIGGSPSTVQFFLWSGKSLASTANATGQVDIKWNQTYKAVIQFDPSRTGTWELWASANATNEFAANYQNGANQAHVQVNLNPNPIVLEEEVAGVIAVAAAVIAGGIYYFRRRGSKPVSKGSDKAKLERGGKRDEPDEDDES